jgi:hypothetical protein
MFNLAFSLQPVVQILTRKLAAFVKMLISPLLYEFGYAAGMRTACISAVLLDRTF